MAMVALTTGMRTTIQASGAAIAIVSLDLDVGHIAL